MTPASRTPSGRARAEPCARIAGPAGAVLSASRRSAKIVIDIPEVSEPIDNNVRAFLSLTRYAERQDVDAEVMSRLQRRIVTETREALQPLGYYEPEVTYEVHPSGADWRVDDPHQARPTGATVRSGDRRRADRGPNERAIREVVGAGCSSPGLRLNHGAVRARQGRPACASRRTRATSTPV